MGFQFAKSKKWVDNAIFYFVTSFLTLLGIVVPAYKFNNIDTIVLIVGLISIFFGVIQGLHSLRLSEKDYIYLDDDHMYIYRIIALPKREIRYEDIDHCVQKEVHDVELMVLHLKDGREVDIQCKWLGEEDLNQLKGILMNKLNDHPQSNTGFVKYLN